MGLLTRQFTHSLMYQVLIHFEEFSPGELNSLVVRGRRTDLLVLCQRRQIVRVWHFLKSQPAALLTHLTERRFDQGARHSFQVPRRFAQLFCVSSTLVQA